ncbi:MAG: sulfite exporter TauE/SafE family protein, partial [Coriobacteriales bacterium]|nr:sulfite exporter TauE/SafE family protein [Coriobacteriales bacterium]
MITVAKMTCASCQNRIEKKLRRAAGIVSADVSYRAGTATLTYRPAVITLGEIVAIIEDLGYQVVLDKRQAPASRKAVAVLIIALAAFMFMQQFGFAGVFNLFPTAEAGMSYWMLFAIGVLTSVHCMAMCGGINLSQCIPQGVDSSSKAAALRPSVLYNLGRVVSYTLVGAIVGALGSVIALTGGFRGAVQLIAGIFMIIMAVNMLGAFPGLRRLTPRMPRVFARRIEAEKSKSNSPLVVGLLNGLM